MATETTSQPVEPVEPPLPEAAYSVVNPFLKAVLRSPLHFLVSDMLLTLAYRGQKSGKVHATPVGYERRDDTLLVTSSYDSIWWTNLRGGQPVYLHLKGEKRRGIADVTEDAEEVAAYLQEFIDRHGTEGTGRVGIRIAGDHEPTPEELRTAAENVVLVRVTLDGDEPT